ncbi:hypothetical protein [Mammaliicoccus sciuri]|uniref:hypothetical protein n=1 Tax=Mammaliicoccus sciuri TaxID=1296 RepID=UPI002B261889|nr:hypothetical protein [Mammaliicoccus sciuri]WQK75291.1 hypothetical protein P3U33_06035 [Mammaliicoccus sciuri]
MKKQEYAAQLEKAFNASSFNSTGRVFTVSGREVSVAISDFNYDIEDLDSFEAIFRVIGGLEGQFSFEVVFDLQKANISGLQDYLKTNFIPDMKKEISNKLIEIEERNEVYVKSKEVFDELLPKG